MIKDHQAIEVAFQETRELFVAFGDHYRQEIILLLSQHQNMTVKVLAQELNLSRPATSHHIKILREAGMLGVRKDGVRTYYYPTLRKAFDKVKSLIDAADGIIE